jgi:hypothetical protein
MNSSDQTSFDDELTELAARLPAGVSPGRDLWPAIEQGISASGKAQAATFWNFSWAQAAAVVLLVAGSSGITYVAVSDGSLRAPEIIYTDNIFETVSGDFGQQYTLGNEYMDARSQLESDFEGKLNALSPNARSEVVQNLNTIRRAIRDINQALAAEPDNTLLQELLLSSYHDEMSLMKKIDGIANSAMRRDDI